MWLHTVLWKPMNRKRWEKRKEGGHVVPARGPIRDIGQKKIHQKNPKLAIVRASPATPARGARAMDKNVPKYV